MIQINIKNTISPNASVSIINPDDICVTPIEVCHAVVSSDEIEIFLYRYQALLRTLYGLKDSIENATTLTIDPNDGEHLVSYITGLDDVLIIKSGCIGEDNQCVNIFGIYFISSGILYSMDYLTYLDCDRIYHNLVSDIMPYDESNLIEELYEFLNDYYPADGGLE